MKNILGPLLIGGGIIGITKIYSVMNKKQDPAKKMVIDEFMKILKKNKEIKLEEAILLFEMSEEKDLDEFALNKGRTSICYINTYKKYFEIAKKKLNI